MSPPAAHGVSRRYFLRRAMAGGLGLGALAAVGYGIDDLASGDGTPSSAPRHPPNGTTALSSTPSTEMSTLPSGVVVPTASWVQAENARPGTLDWIVGGRQAPRAIEGFASAVSAVAGEEVVLFASSATARSFHVEAYRMGYYQGLGGRLVWRSDSVQVVPQPAPVVTSGVNTVSCHWAPSLSFRVDGLWPPGAYLLKLVGDGGQQQYVPFCVRDDASASAFLVQHSVTTWQAYNLWGGYSLYFGLTGGAPTYEQTPAGKDFAHRARVVSFDRPYPQDWAQGAADFMGLEFPLVYDMERLGLDVSYTTDVDVHRRPELLLRHRCLMSLGHDEYWSLEMRLGVAQARDAGVNLAFMGANACYRPIRFQASPVGPDRLQVCYKSATEDPLNGLDNARTTPITWASAPTSWHESQLIGSTYKDIDADADLVVHDPGSWWWSGTGATEGQKLPHAVQGEYGCFDPSSPGPKNVEVLARSPVTNRGAGRFSDVTWFTVPGGGGVFSAGCTAFVNKLASSSGVPTNVLPGPVPGVTDVLLRAMENLYSVLGAGPASASHASAANWQGLPAATTPAKAVPAA